MQVQTSGGIPMSARLKRLPVMTAVMISPKLARSLINIDYFNINMIQRPDLDQKYVGSCFDRQVRIQLWDQDKLKTQTAFIMGVGGLGSVVMMNLLRLGIKKLILLDYDVVDVHNLNRQLMFTPGDIGQSKVESAKKNARFHNIDNTQIQTFHGNALTNWQKIIQLAKQSDVLFNCIDYGDKFDLAVASLAMKLSLPLIMGGTFSTMYTVDFINPKGEPCFLCLNEQTGQEVELVQKLEPQKILQIEDLSFLPKNDNPISRSSVAVCTLCGEIMISHFLNYLFLHENPPYKTSRLIGYHNTFEIINFEIEVVKKCFYCGDPNYVEPPKEEENKAEANEAGDKEKTQEKQQGKENQNKTEENKKDEQNKPEQSKPEQNKQEQIKQEQNKPEQSKKEQKKDENINESEKNQEKTEQKQQKEEKQKEQTKQEDKAEEQKSKTEQAKEEKKIEEERQQKTEIGEQKQVKEENKKENKQQK